MRRAWVAVAFLAFPLSGCASDPPEPEAVSFTVTYAAPELPGPVVVSLAGPAPYLDADGQRRLGYALRAHAPENPLDEGAFQVLDASLRVVRESFNCPPNAHCHAAHTLRWPTGSWPLFGVGAPRNPDWAGQAAERRDGRSLRHEGATFHYGGADLFPQRIVLDRPGPDQSPVAWRLVRAERGPPLAQADPWPRPETRLASEPQALLPPGSATDAIGLGFTVADAVQAIRESDAQAPAILDEGCLLMLWAAPIEPHPPGTLQPVFGGRDSGTLSLTFRRGSDAFTWDVRQTSGLLDQPEWDVSRTPGFQDNRTCEELRSPGWPAMGPDGALALKPSWEPGGLASFAVYPVGELAGGPPFVYAATFYDEAGPFTELRVDPYTARMDVLSWSRDVDPDSE